MNERTAARHASNRPLGLARLLEQLWYGRHPAAAVLAPLSGIFRGVVSVRRWAFNHGLRKIHRLPVPVVIVGNLTVGGTGKTPLVIWLAGYLQSLGFHPAVIARGHGGKARRWPQQVRTDSDPRTVGDEAIVIARRTHCPVAVGPDRVACAQAVLEHVDCDVIISDDGLQHYAIGRDVEIVVVDGVRRFGNGRCLPAGPLREPSARVRDYDMVVANGTAGRGEFSMKYVATHALEITSPTHSKPLDKFATESVHAVAGLGNPAQFFAMLRAKGLSVIPHPFPDHHVYGADELRFGDTLPVLMTEKDAVKCEMFAQPGWWSVPITAELPELFATRLETLLKQGGHG